ncbi:hypothetical protein HMPREF0496_2019 [Lentilactobacillus hilgardii ATCC 27305]|nr:hypothetical protein HMPREF0496_2019 [Lentilactobacillus hilgardii ATCC 27305]
MAKIDLNDLDIMSSTEAANNFFNRSLYHPVKAFHRYLDK